MKLLIVEEVPAMRRLIRSLLEDLALTVDECHDGRETLAACAARRPDWVLLDLNLSDTDAMEAARQIGIVHPRMNILIFAEQDNFLLREQARTAGARAYVLKENLLELRVLLQRAAAQESDQQSSGNEE
ncbi:MAG: response regulator [Pyrinomonadaceae bacterium]|nr:response regulator [Pyrinomonadaceae bacterium]